MKAQYQSRGSLQSTSVLNGVAVWRRKFAKPPNAAQQRWPLRVDQPCGSIHAHSFAERSWGFTGRLGRLIECGASPASLPHFYNR